MCGDRKFGFEFGFCKNKIKKVVKNFVIKVCIINIKFFF